MQDTRHHLHADELLRLSLQYISVAGQKSDPVHLSDNARHDTPRSVSLQYLQPLFRTDVDEGRHKDCKHL